MGRQLAGGHSINEIFGECLYLCILHSKLDFLFLLIALFFLGKGGRVPEPAVFACPVPNRTHG